MQELLSLLGIGGGGLLTKEAYDRLGSMGDSAIDKARGLTNEALAGNEFTGYGVTSNLGGSNVDAQGNLNMYMTPSQENFAGTAHVSSLGMMNRATGDTSARENDIFQKIRAMQQPGEQRQQMELNNQLLNQGRAGVRSNMYGGTPEQLALSKAQAEAQNSAAFGAIESARQQQGQDANLANLFGQMQYMPQDQIRKDTLMGQQTYGYKDAANRNNANLMAEGLFSGLDANLASKLGQANLMGELGTAMFGAGGNMMTGAINSGSDTFSKFIESIFK